MQRSLYILRAQESESIKSEAISLWCASRGDYLTVYYKDETKQKNMK